MTGKRELVALLYRADWTRLCLSGEVHGPGEPMMAGVTGTTAATETWPMPDPRFPPFERGVNDRTLLLAPGRRYREESVAAMVSASGGGTPTCRPGW
jgi:hypothetical protein